MLRISSYTPSEISDLIKKKIENLDDLENILDLINDQANVHTTMLCITHQPLYEESEG